MLRLQRERDTKNIPYLHAPQQPKPTNPLHRLGEELADAVRASVPANAGNLLKIVQ